MLTHVDVFIGVAMVMLAVSLLLTIVTQIVSFLGNLRGKHLRSGLTELFETLKVDTGAVGRAKLVEQILQHPLVRGGATFDRLAPAISKADLLSLLDGAKEFLGVEETVAIQLKNAAAGVERWFDAAMRRVSNRFTMSTRIITIVVATIAAFALQLDAFGLVKRLYADSDLRAKLAGAAGTMVAQGETVLATPSVFGEVAKALATESQGALATPAAGAVQTREEAETWIRGAVADPQKAQTLLSRYDELVQAAIGPSLKHWLGQAADIRKQLADTGLRLVPEPYRPRPFESLWVFLGVLSSAGLLSLGAPFWFNTLKSVSNLRPAIAAQVQEREPASAQKPPDRFREPGTSPSWPAQSPP
jgi:hypothetical protein